MLPLLQVVIHTLISFPPHFSYSTWRDKKLFFVAFVERQNILYTKPLKLRIRAFLQRRLPELFACASI